MNLFPFALVTFNCLGMKYEKLQMGLGVEHICIGLSSCPNEEHIQVHFGQNFAQLAKLLSCPHSPLPSSPLIGQVKFSFGAGTFH